MDRQIDCPVCGSDNTAQVVGSLFQRQCMRCFGHWDIRSEEEKDNDEW